MIVVDCSAVVDALVADDADELAAVVSSSRVMAPHLIDFEVVSALRGLVSRGHLSADRAADALEDYDDLAITRWAFAADLRRRAFGLRENFSAYDASYVVLAEALDCPLVTRDRRLATAARGMVEVITA